MHHEPCIIIIKGYLNPRPGNVASLVLIRRKYEVRPSADSRYQYEGRRPRVLILAISTRSNLIFPEAVRVRRHVLVLGYVIMLTHFFGALKKSASRAKCSRCGSGQVDRRERGGLVGTFGTLCVWWKSGREQTTTPSLAFKQPGTNINRVEGI